MLKSKNILFIISLLFGVIFFTSENMNEWMLDFDDQISFVESNEEEQSEDSSDDKPLYISKKFLLMETTLTCTPVSYPENQFVINLKYPIWLPPKIS